MSCQLLRQPSRARGSSAAGRRPRRVPTRRRALPSIEESRAGRLVRPGAGTAWACWPRGANWCTPASPPGHPSTTPASAIPRRQTPAPSFERVTVRRQAGASLRVSGRAGRPRCTTPPSFPNGLILATDPQCAGSAVRLRRSAATPSWRSLRPAACPRSRGRRDARTPGRTRAPRPVCTPPMTASRQEAQT